LSLVSFEQCIGLNHIPSKFPDWAKRCEQIDSTGYESSKRWGLIADLCELNNKSYRRRKCFWEAFPKAALVQLHDTAAWGWKNVGPFLIRLETLPSAFSDIRTERSSGGKYISVQLYFSSSKTQVRIMDNILPKAMLTIGPVWISVILATAAWAIWRLTRKNYLRDIRGPKSTSWLYGKEHRTIWPVRCLTSSQVTKWRSTSRVMSANSTSRGQTNSREPGKSPIALESVEFCSRFEGMVMTKNTGRDSDAHGPQRYQLYRP
jgi:hypothetical protein